MQLKKVKLTNDDYNKFNEINKLLVEKFNENSYNRNALKIMMDNYSLLKRVNNKNEQCSSHIKKGDAIKFNGKNHIVETVYLSFDKIKEELFISRVKCTDGICIEGDANLRQIKVLK